MKFSLRIEQSGSNILQQLEQKRKELAANGEDVINLSVGTPDLPPDRFVMNVISEACRDSENFKYSLGDMPALVDAVVGWYDRRYNVKLERDEVTSVNGSQEGISHIAFPICDVGDIVLVPNPGYPIFSYGPFLAGAQLVTYDLLKENDYLIDFASIDEDTARKAKMIVVSYPNNPVTAIANEDFFERLVAFAKKYDIVVVHDNAYSELVYDTPPCMSFLSVKGAKDVGIEFNSLSKSYNLTGCRISFAVGNKEVIDRFKSLRSQIDYGIFYPIQLGAVAALNGPQDILERNRAAYKERRDLLCSGLCEIGWNVPTSVATMFTWFPIPPKFNDSYDFTVKLLEKSGVICVPGGSFGELGNKYVRMALVQNTDTIKRAILNIKNSGILE